MERLKFVDARVTFSEVPDEITLCLNISNCPNRCPGCHSEYLQKDIGYTITMPKIDAHVVFNKGITCICFMGGDNSPKQVNFWANKIKKKYPNLKVAWYSGKEELSKDIDLNFFDFIKLGPYKKEFGPLNRRTTNQRFYEVFHFTNGKNELIDRTCKFWKEND